MVIQKNHVAALTFVGLLAVPTFVEAARGGPREPRRAARASAASSESTTPTGLLSTFIVVITGGQETIVPPHLGIAKGHGTGLVTLDEDTGIVCWSIAHTDLPTESRAHFHAARPGEDGAAHVWPPVPASLPLGSPKDGCTGPLEDEALHLLRAGLWYLQIHTDEYVLGELRGQILPIHVYGDDPVHDDEGGGHGHGDD